MTLSDADLRVIEDALRVAIVVYRLDAVKLASVTGHERVRDQFERQADAALELLTRIQDR
jgi:CHASE1-domain containing sensor protein